MKKLRGFLVGKTYLHAFGSGLKCGIGRIVSIFICEFALSSDTQTCNLLPGSFFNSTFSVELFLIGSSDLHHNALWRNKKAGDGNRTHVTSLEGWSFTIKLHPRKLHYYTKKDRFAILNRSSRDESSKFATTIACEGCPIRSTGSVSRLQKRRLFPLSDIRTAEALCPSVRLATTLLTRNRR